MYGALRCQTRGVGRALSAEHRARLSVPHVGSQAVIYHIAELEDRSPTRKVVQRASSRARICGCKLACLLLNRLSQPFPALGGHWTSAGDRRGIALRRCEQPWLVAQPNVSHSLLPVSPKAGAGSFPRGARRRWRTQAALRRVPTLSQKLLQELGGGLLPSTCFQNRNGDHDDDYPNDKRNRKPLPP